MYDTGCLVLKKKKKKNLNGKKNQHDLPPVSQFPNVSLQSLCKVYSCAWKIILCFLGSTYRTYFEIHCGRRKLNFNTQVLFTGWHHVLDTLHGIKM